LILLDIFINKPLKFAKKLADLQVKGGDVALRFKLKNLAETVIEELKCPGCGLIANDEQLFSTDLTRLTKDGIIVMAECRCCGEVFIPTGQRTGIMDVINFREVINREYSDESFPAPSRNSMELEAEKLNAIRRYGLH
jgi:hypothetical protein